MKRLRLSTNERAIWAVWSILITAYGIGISVHENRAHPCFWIGAVSLFALMFLTEERA